VNDTCCESLKDPTKHWIRKIFGTVERAPYRDNFHSQKMVTDSMNSSNILYPSFCGELASVMLNNDETTERIAVDAYIRNEKSNLTRELAKQRMLQIESYKKSIM